MKVKGSREQGKWVESTWGGLYERCVWWRRVSYTYLLVYPVQRRKLMGEYTLGYLGRITEECKTTHDIAFVWGLWNSEVKDDVLSDPHQLTPPKAERNFCVYFLSVLPSNENWYRFCFCVLWVCLHQILQVRNKLQSQAALLEEADSPWRYQPTWMQSVQAYLTVRFMKKLCTSEPVSLKSSKEMTNSHYLCFFYRSLISPLFTKPESSGHSVWVVIPACVCTTFQHFTSMPVDCRSTPI